MSTYPYTTCGLDVGYGNCKLSAHVAGESQVREVVMPIGAVPLEQAPKKLSGGHDIRDGVIVSLDGAKWVAGVEPTHLQGFVRPTHENYPATNEYRALMIGALVKAGIQEVDMLYTGVPVGHYYGHGGNALRTQISNTMTGTHWVDANTAIKVKATVVVPQAAGAFMDILSRSPDMKPSKGSPSLVVDVGYYSVDWVRVIDGLVKDSSSGSSTNATSILLEKASSLIAQKYRRPISAGRLEDAFRTGNHTIDWGQVTLNLLEWLDLAAAEITPKVFSGIAAMQRQEVDFPNMVILTGGGGSLYKKAAEEAFPHSKVVVSREPVMANARGFQGMAALKQAHVHAQTGQAA
jgi:plasmid segregation protein ParM|nr:ParM/StbA family protein [Stenotrophomonas pavanii]